MAPQELKELVDEATAGFNEADVQYKKHILDYAVGLLIAGLSVIGFLLQNRTTQKIIKGTGTKTSFLIFLFLTLMSIVTNIIAKRFAREYSRNVMHSYQYQVMSTSDINVTINGIDRPPQEDDSDKASSLMRKAIPFDKLSKRFFSYSEIFLVSALISAVVFIVILIVQL